MGVDFFLGDELLSRVEKLITDNKYVLAADVLKIIVLDRFGGIYGDLGIAYNGMTYNLLRVANYGLIYSGTDFFQTSFLACAPGSSLTSIFRAVLNYPASLDRTFAMSGPTPGPLDEVSIFAGPGLTVCALLFLEESARVLILPPQSPGLLLWRSEQSWYGEQGKYGNTVVHQSNATILNGEDFESAETSFSQSVQVFGSLPKLREQIRILVGTQPYFAGHATAFCEAFYFSGSDKAQAWHNYAYVYHFLFRSLFGKVRGILEIGIGTNYLDVPSTMGVRGIPGASLRAWRELFPFATVIGADVDKRILFRDENIETYFVDSTKSETVHELFSSIGQCSLDIIIDDGLHTFEANTTLLTAAYPHLATDTLYVIEDVLETDLGAWQKFLPETGLNSIILRLPHSSKATDNCLVIIPGGQDWPRTSVHNRLEEAF